ncbi:hypothetical protein HMPREF9946_01414 [Acetobacteraceae bacterium AT-5844]|nr:hypothetical protein HMPREF9946_01414 [Acetobacteraceae bacterium AT-5844]
MTLTEFRLIVVLQRSINNLANNGYLQSGLTPRICVAAAPPIPRGARHL